MTSNHGDAKLFARCGTLSHVFQVAASLEARITAPYPIRENQGCLASSADDDATSNGSLYKRLVQGKVAELRQELHSGGKKDKNNSAKKIALKKIVANMTMSNNDMVLPILGELLKDEAGRRIKSFAHSHRGKLAKPRMGAEANMNVQDMEGSSPLVRALALRTMSYIHVKEFVDGILPPLKKLMTDEDPYVRKTAAFCVAKVYDHDRRLVEKSDLIDRLNRMLKDGNPTVVASALASLMDIWERSESIKLTIDYASVSKIVSILPDCTEWGQTYILESMMSFIPQDTGEALLLAERIAPRLSHSNSAVVLTCIRVILYLMNYIADEKQISSLSRKLSPPLVTLLSKGPEVQYLALRNAILILQRRPEVLRSDIRVFFCKYNDPIYVKVTKLELIFMLANAENIGVVLTELREYATEIDVHFVRKAVRAIGKLAIKIESAARQCIDTLLELVKAKIPYIVQEATVVIRNIFRKYPNQYESVITTVIDQIDDLDEPEAKAAIIWIIGQYADRIDQSDELLKDYLSTFHDEPIEVQLALLTATVKLFILRPTKASTLVPQVLKWCTEETDDPDLRDRGFMYWRLLSTDPATAKKIVTGAKPPISAESEKLDYPTLEELCLNIGTLATVYLKPVHQVFRGARPRRLIESPALQKREPDPSVQESPSLPIGSLPTASQIGSPTHARQQQQSANGLAAAVDAADLYFQGLGSQQMAHMTLGGNSEDRGDRRAGAMLSSPSDSGFGSTHAPQTGYVVNQNQPQQVYQPQIAEGGDLLL